MFYDHVEISEFIGKTLVSVAGCEEGSEVVLFEFEDGSRYQMFHNQDCCESVRLEDIVGDMGDLVGTEIAIAYEADGDTPNDYDMGYSESYTWTFYTLRSLGGTVVLRWLGESNGYYSESVDIVRVG